MSSTRKLSSRLTQLLELFNRNDDWLIVINADPDAMASAMALKRIMSHRTGKVTIARINEISRPDNLAMIRYLRIPMLPLTDKLKASYSHFAMVDSQPHHNPAFAGIPFSIVIDHHPAVPEHPVDAAYVDIRPQYGAVSTLLTEYLRAYHIRPGIRLATALQRYPYGYRHVYPHGHGNRPARLPVSRRSRGHRLAHAHNPQRIPPRVAQILCARLLVHASVRLRGLLLSGYGGEPRYTRGGCGFLYACSQHQVGRRLRRVQRYCRCHLPGRRSCRSWRIRRTS